MPNDSLQNVGKLGKIGKMMPNDSLQNVGKLEKFENTRKRQSEARLEPYYRTKTLSISKK